MMNQQIVGLKVDVPEVEATEIEVSVSGGKDVADVEYDAPGEDDELPEDQVLVQESEDDDFIGGGELFEKAIQYDAWLDKPNPWHPDLKRELFPAQIIGYRWMTDRHPVGGGLVADKVGTGKVSRYLTFHAIRLTGI